MLFIVIALIIGILLGIFIAFISKKYLFKYKKISKTKFSSLIDLTRTLQHNMPVYQEGAYRDPPFLITPWCDIPEQGYCVSHLELGTQTGTHIDAPRHFVSDGATLDQLSTQALVGNYLLLDIDNNSQRQTNLNHEAAFLFLRFNASSTLTAENFAALVHHPALIWIVSGKPQVANWHHLKFHQELARAGKYLVEELDDNTTSIVQADGLVIVAPLRLNNVSGSPCRVLILQ